MSISNSERIHLICPACATGFAADIWTLVDAGERPDLAQALRDGALDTASCPACGMDVAVDAPLLFHDPVHRRVYFAVPSGVSEYAWRERAQELLYAMVASIPEEERLPYLGDIQIEHEIAGLRRAVLRRDRGRKGGPAARGQLGRPADRPQEVEPEPAAPAPPLVAPSPIDERLLDAVRALLASDSEAEFAAVVSTIPELLSDAGDAALRQLVDLAYGEGQHDVAAALREVRAALSRMRAGGGIDSAGRPGDAERLENVDSQLPTLNSQLLSDAAYQALLQAASREELLAAARDYPALLESWVDDELSARIDAALDEGNERLSQTIEARGEELAELRDALSRPEAVSEAIGALIDAGGEDALASVLARYPILLSETAQVALASLAERARAHGDQIGAAQSESRGALLRTVRAGLEER